MTDLSCEICGFIAIFVVVGSLLLICQSRLLALEFFSFLFVNFEVTKVGLLTHTFARWIQKVVVEGMR